MSNYHCVLDASALLKKYRPETGSDKIRMLFNRDDCALHILNVTIPEVTGVFVRWQLDGKLSPDKRAELKDLFIADITEYRVVIHNITDRNIIDTDNVWDTSIGVKQPRLPNTDKLVECPKCRHPFTTPVQCPECHYSFIEKISHYKPRVVSVDVLVLGVCLGLKKNYRKIYLFSSDEHMLKVAKRMGINASDPEKITRLPFPNSR